MHRHDDFCFTPTKVLYELNHKEEKIVCIPHAHHCQHILISIHLCFDINYKAPFSFASLVSMEPFIAALPAEERGARRPSLMTNDAPGNEYQQTFIITLPQSVFLVPRLTTFSEGVCVRRGSCTQAM